MNYYMPPYLAAKEAGVATFMASFNEINGVPSTGNKWLMTDLLRKDWGFNGFVVTDYTGINEMVAIVSCEMTRRLGNWLRTPVSIWI